MVKNSQGPRPSPLEIGKQQPTCPDKAKIGSTLSEKIFISGHLDNLFRWWECETRVPKVPLAAENTGDMGERYENNGGGGNFGREGGGPNKQHQFDG
jgi:hypothetical protein